MGIINICIPEIISRKVEKKYCPNCKRDQAFLVEHLSWYGEDRVCLVCGDRWNDEELCPRPFSRGWRRKSVQRALDRLDKPIDHERANEMIKMEKSFQKSAGGGPENPPESCKTV